MRRGFMFSVFLVLFAFMAGCATYHVPVSACGPPSGSKTGTVSAITYFGVFGDMSQLTIENAARNGNISNVCTAEVTTKNTLFILQTHTLTVKGE
jgi:hypothetical protein